jgi:hypothetical protein
MVRTAIRGLLGLVAVVGAFHVAPVARADDKAAGKPLASRDLDIEGITAEVIESVRKDGVLTVRVRLRNTGQKAQKVLLVRGGQSYDAAYLSAKDTKYTLITDARQRAVATPADAGGWVEPSIKPKASWNWWGKFPAPPPDVKSYTLYLKVGPPIEDVPIIDRK